MPRLSRRPLAAILAAGLGACGGAPNGDAPVLALVEIASPVPPGSAQPDLSTTPDGRILLSWLEPDSDSTHALRFAALGPHTEEGEAAWSAARTVARGPHFFVNWADFPSVVALPDGSLAAHWLVRSGPGTYAYDVHVARSADGGATWTGHVVPHRDGTATEHGFVSLFPAAAGALAAVWLDGRKFADADGAPATNEMTVRTTTVSADGTAAPETVLDERACDCCQTAAALTADGPIVVYRDRSPGEVRDISIVRLVDGAWTGPRTVHDDGWVIAACPVNGPAADADGRRVAVAWFTAAQDTPRVRLAFSADAGASFAPPVRVDDGNPVGRVDVLLLDDGAALVSWLENTGDAAELRVRRVTPAGGAGPALTVAATSGARASGFPRMARRGDGVVFAWTEPGSPSRVRVAAARLPR